MFFVLLFLGVTSVSAYAFPEWAWSSVLLVSVTFVVAVRLILFPKRR
jgi:hypothetical protein